MTTRYATVTNLINKPGGSVYKVKSGSVKLNVPGAFTVDHVEIVGVSYVNADDNGDWQITLPINADIAKPTNTTWTIREKQGSGFWTVQLGTEHAGGTFPLDEVLVADPLNPNPIVAGASIAALAAETSARVSGDAATLASAASDATAKASAAQSAAVSTASSDATTKAGAAQSAAVATAATDATSKANAAQAAAIAAAAADATSKDDAVKAFVASGYATRSSAVGGYTYDVNGNVTATPDGTTYTWESDGAGGYRVHTETVGTTVRTFSYAGDGSLASVA